MAIGLKRSALYFGWRAKSSLFYPENVNCSLDMKPETEELLISADPNLVMATCIVAGSAHKQSSDFHLTFIWFATM